MAGAEPRFSAGDPMKPGVGVLLLHDLAGTPQQFERLADALTGAGFTVDAPLLPGHGTVLDDLDETSWDDWAAASQLALDELASRAGPIVVTGLGVGAALACWAGASHPAVRGVVAVNPRAMPVPDDAVLTLEAMAADGAVTVAPLRPDVSDRAARVVGYDTVPVRTLISMFGAIRDMADHWGEVTCPALLVTSARDHRIAPVNTDWLAERLGGPVERLLLERSFHLATLDVEHVELEEAVVDFAQRVGVSPRPLDSSE